MNEAPKIYTNGHRYTLLTWHDLPTQAKADFDYLAEDERFDVRFVRYRGPWYDVQDFMFVPEPDQSPPNGPGHWAAGWDAYQSDSFFSGVLVRYVDADQVVMGTYIS